MISDDSDKGTRILDAALALFTEDAYGSVTIPQIAGRAKVAAGTIYRYFSSKDDLANAVYQREKSAMRDALVTALEALGPDADAESSARACWAALMGLLADRRAGVLFLEGQQHAAYLTAESRAIGHEIDALAFGIITRGQQAGVIKSGAPEVFVAMLFGSFVGLAKILESTTDDITSATASAAWDLISS